MVILTLMSWVSVIWSGLAGATLMLAIIHVMVWYKRRTAKADLAFSLMAVATATAATCELWIMGSQTVGQIGTAVRWYHVPLWTAIVSLVLFTRLFLLAGRAWLAWAVITLRTAGLVLNFLVSPNISFREIAGVKHIAFLGGSVSLVEGVTNPLMLILQLGTLLLLVFVADAAAVAWRRGDRRSALAVGGSTVFFVAAALSHSVLVIWQIAPMPLMNSLFYVGVLAAMGYETTRKALRAGELADDLRESEARYRSILERSSEGIYRTSAEGRILFANPASAKILGYDSPDDLIRSITDLAAQVWDVPGERSRLMRLVEEGGAVHGHECRFRRKDGSLVWVSLSSRPFRGPDGRILYFDGIFTNIDERKRADEGRRQSEERFRALAESSLVGIYVLQDGKYAYVNPAMASVFGYSVAEMTGMTPREIVQPSDHGTVGENIRRRITGEVQAVQYEVRGRYRDGSTRDVEVYGTRVEIDGRPALVGTLVDITARKRSEVELAELRAERTHLARALTVDEISTSLAHEINQPLGAILNNAEAARALTGRPEGKPELIVEIIDDIIADAKRAGDVVRKVRGVLRKGEAKFERLPVNALIEEALEIFLNNLALNGVAHRLELGADLADIRGDRVRLQQVLMNLITNAMDAMRGSPSKLLTVRAAMDGPDTVTFSVGDSGPGIPEGSRNRIFEPFFTTKKGGLGLGLPICRSIVEEHGGRIWLDDRPGGGTTISFSLKAWQETAG